MVKPRLYAKDAHGRRVGSARLTEEDTWDVFDARGRFIDTVPRTQDAERQLLYLGAARVIRQ